MTIAGANRMLLLRDGGRVREGVARRSRTGGGSRAGGGLLTSLICLISQQIEVTERA